MLSTAVLVDLGLFALAACLGLLLGASAFLGDMPLGWLVAVLGVAAIAVAATATLELWRRRAPRAAPGPRPDAAVPGQTLQLARHDALTGLPNRHALIERLSSTIGGNRRSERMTAVLTVDLADFRAINATLGCAAGDLLLRHASARLLAGVRETDTLARMGADEFAIIQRGVDGPASAAALCDRLLAAFDEPFDLFGHLTQVAVRIGVALHPADGNDADELLKHSAIALGRAKAEGAGALRFYEEVMDIELQERKALERDLVHALERGQLEVHYQPQIDIPSRRMVGVEALLRWHHPERGPVPPDRFIPLAEDNGAILPIGAWVLEQACAQAVRWQQAGAPTLRVSVNLSPVQFRHRDLAGLVGDVLARTGLAARHLELEITERVLMEDTAANLDTLRQLKDQGVSISIDDFGVGHSSLSYLRSFPFDEIKLDRSFIGALEHDPSAAAIVRATLSLGRSLGLHSVAEGVESAAQLEMLEAEGCGIAQGYYFSPAVHPREIDVMIEAIASARVDENDYDISRTA